MNQSHLVRAALVCALVLGVSCAMAESVTVYRDSWGTPHVIADSEKAAAYGLGYAQAEDRLGDMYINIRTAVGRMAEAFGAQHVERDYYMRAIKNEERCEAYYATAPQHQKDLIEGFIAGVNAYIAEHPENVPAWSVEIKPAHLLAIGRAMIMGWPLGTIQDELRRRENSVGRSSNEWSVAPSRSAEGCAILLTDPHLTWEGLAVFYEATVHCPTLTMNGFFIVGSPLLGLGHNANVGWACTTGGPDTSDVYEVKINPQNPLQYEYDGEMHTAELSMVTIPVKDGKPVQRPVAYTLHGMVVSEPDMEKGVVYVGATPYLDAMGLFEQTYRMCKAKNSDDFYEALGMNQLMEQNVMFADTRGNIQYVRTGRVPIRPEGYDWSRPVPGNSSATAWKGIHPIEDLVQIKNPPQGYMQNCNISPANMMVDSPLTPEKYLKYLYNVSWDQNNTRGRRAIEVLSKDESITKEEAIALVMDVYDVRAPEWHDALTSALTTHGEKFADDAAFQQAVDTLKGWDGLFTRDSVAGPIVMYWREAARSSVDTDAIASGKALDEANQLKLLEALRDGLAKMKETYGDAKVTWGDIHVVGRGGKYYPVGGADFGGGSIDTRTLFDVAGRPDPENPGRYIANNGSMSMLLMFMYEDGVESYSCIPWGQSANPESPHYMDQGEELYARREMKRTRWTEDAILADVKSEKRFTID